MTPTSPTPGRPELWGGIECTVNRVGDRYFDQLERSGHARRPEDLERIAELGIRTLRYPLLWERIAPEHPDWSWADERMRRLQALHLRPIVGLLHHGSGPRSTSLLDPGFAAGLAAHAARVAQRFPWVELYNPVNEPLTTARFSGLYGHWYPHARDDRVFARAFLNQCRAVVLAMHAIRRVQPAARLVQTEDLSKTHSTPALAYQADFENERRWLTFDLLCGRIDRHHPLGAFFLYLGIDEAELAWFQENACPPDVLGVNHYLTSERFLDERLERYPPYSHGGNGRHAYADVESVRVHALDGPERLFREAWQRYGMPLAITEVHLGCTREEQLRWLWEVWQAAVRLRHEGIDLRAVTTWALLGTYDWDSLVTRERGYYEPGAFDVRGPQPRPTAIARLVRDLATGGEPNHPILEIPGWWRRPERISYPLDGPPADAPLAFHPAGQPIVHPLLIAGGAGTLGQAFGRICAARGLPCRLMGRREMDVTSRDSVAATLDEVSPWAVINAAGYSRPDDAERSPDACRRGNVIGPANLARACRARGMPLLTFSSDCVFDGHQRQVPWIETDPVRPLGVFARSKVEGEREIAQLWPRALVVRAGPLFGPWDEGNFVTGVLRALAGGQRVAAADDLVVSPTYVPDLVHVCLDLLIDDEAGVWHLANVGAITWLELARAAARGAGLDGGAVEGRPAATFDWAAPRPPYLALGSERGQLMPTLEDALARYERERTVLSVAVPLGQA